MNVFQLWNCNETTVQRGLHVDCLHEAVRARRLGDDHDRSSSFGCGVVCRLSMVQERMSSPSLGIVFHRRRLSVWPRWRCFQSCRWSCWVVMSSMCSLNTKLFLSFSLTLDWYSATAFNVGGFRGFAYFVFWLVPFSLISLGTTLGFQTVAGRTVVLTALLLQVISLAYYTSNMVSALTVGPSLPALNDLRDVHNDPAITFGFVKGTANTADFRVGCALCLELFSCNVFGVDFHFICS